MRERLIQFRKAHPPQFLRVDGEEWSYLAAGRGPCIVLLPGGPGGGESLFEYVEALEDSFRVIAPSIPPIAGSWTGVLRGLEAVLDAESIAVAHVFGHSEGAMIAQAFVRAHPERTASLVLANAVPPSEARARRVSGQLRWARSLPPFILRFFLKRSLARLLDTDAPELDAAQRRFWPEYFREAVAAPDLREALISSARLQLDFHRNLSTGTGDPTGWNGRVLIFESSGDTLVSVDEFAALRAAWPGAVVHRFEGAGHLGWIGRVDSYVVRIRLFCGERAARSGRG